MLAVNGRHALQTGCVKPYAVQVEADWTAGSGGEVDPRLGRVDAVADTNFPLAVGYLSDECAVRGIVIKVPPSAALAQPEEGSVFQPHGICARVGPPLDPWAGRFPEQRLCRACCRLGDIEIEPSLLTILNV